jgi:phosphoglucosamine mutase
MARRYFGTDGVRGVVGDNLTAELVERLGRAAALWAGTGRVLIGRDTRGSGLELEQALARGVASAGAEARLGGVLPTPAVALLAGDDLGVVVSASHNPPEYNGIKLFAPGGRKLTDSEEEAVEALLDAPPHGTSGRVVGVEAARDEYVEHVRSHFGSDLTRLRIAVDCANGAYSTIAPEVLRGLGAEATAVGAAPDGENINVGCGATDLRLLRRTVVDNGLDLGLAFDGDGDRLLAVADTGNEIDGDAIVAILALDLGVDLVAVTVMTNLAFHRLMEEHKIRVLTTDVGDRYVLEALRREDGVLGGEQSGHVIYLRDHVTGDGLATGLLLCAALRGRTLAEAAAVLQPYPQAKENVPVARRELPQELLAEVEELNERLGATGRVLVRPSGTEPVVRVLAEAPSDREAEDLCATIAALVEDRLG